MSTQTEYERDYQRGIEAVEHALANGKIMLPKVDGVVLLRGEDGYDDAVLKVAEYFMTALGVNPQ